MRIVLVAPFATQPKGTTRARVLPLAEALVRRGHSVTVLIPAWDNPREAGCEASRGSLRIRWPGLPRPLVPRLSLLLARETLRERPDVVHVFKPKAHSGLALLWLWACGSRIPRVLDSDDWEGRGGWNEVNPYPPWQKAFFQWQENFLPRRCAHAVTVASRTLQTQMWGLGIPPGRVVYLPNGAARERYAGWSTADPRPVRERLLGAAPGVLLYTRFAEFDVARVAEVVARVQRVLPEVRLLVVGKGFFAEEERLKQEMAARGLEQHLVYVGWVPESELPCYLRAADVALFPLDDRLINRAKCSAKLIELMVAGRAIVADAVGEAREMLEHRVSGWLTPPEDVQAQADALVTLLCDAGTREALGKAAAARVWERYDWDTLAERALAAYRLAGAR